jgi:putative serine protease PepD
VAADGYLDLAVLRIYATTDGGPVDPSTLHLPYLKIGDVSSVQLDSPVTLFGYPGVSGSDSITVTSGVVSTFVADASHHVTDPRFQLETTARVAHGNSGGAAVDNAGELIGVPSLEIPGQGGDLSWRLRSVTAAAPLIAAAKAGTPYTSTLLVPLSGNERVLDVGAGASSTEACQGGLTDAQPSDSMWIAFRVSGIPTGLDVAFAIILPDGNPVLTSDLQQQNVPGLPEAVLDQPQGCIGFDVTAAALDRPSLPTGQYQVQLLGGPNLDPLGPVATLTAGVP